MRAYYSLVGRSIVAQIDHKVFEIQRCWVKNNQAIRVVERRDKGGSELVLFEKERLWLIQTLEEAKRWKTGNLFWKKSTIMGNCKMARGYENEYGRFLKISEYSGQGWFPSLLIPEGADGIGWDNLGEALSKGGAVERGPWKREVGGRPLNGNRTRGVQKPTLIANEIDATENFGIWRWAIICESEAKSICWEEVERVVNSVVSKSRRIVLKPCGANMRIFVCHRRSDFVVFKNLKQIKVHDDMIALRAWYANYNSIAKNWAQEGTWIDIIGLPFHRWETKSFKFIGDALGGLLEVKESTRSLEDLTVASIKVGRRTIDIPRWIKIPTRYKPLLVGIKLSASRVSGLETMKPGHSKVGVGLAVQFVSDGFNATSGITTVAMGSIEEARAAESNHKNGKATALECGTSKVSFSKELYVDEADTIGARMEEGTTSRPSQPGSYILEAAPEHRLNGTDHFSQVDNDVTGQLSGPVGLVMFNINDGVDREFGPDGPLTYVTHNQPHCETEQHFDTDGPPILMDKSQPMCETNQPTNQFSPTNIMDNLQLTNETYQIPTLGPKVCQQYELNLLENDPDGKMVTLDNSVTTTERLLDIGSIGELLGMSPLGGEFLEGELI